MLSIRNRIEKLEATAPNQAEARNIQIERALITPDRTPP